MSNEPKHTGYQFDATKVEPQAAFEALPSGWYPMSITGGEVTPNDGGQGLRMALEWTVLDGPMKNRKLFDGFNVQHSNAQTQEIAQKQLSAICHATQVFQFVDIQALFNKPHDVKVDIEPGRWVGPDGRPLDPQPVTASGAPPGSKFYEAKNRFKGAEPIGKKSTGAGAGAAPASSGPAPAWAAGKAAPAAAPAGAPAGTPSWAAPGGKPAAGPAKPTAPAKPKPAAAPAKPAPARKFFVFIDGDNMPLKTETEILAMVTSGMPLETQVSQAGPDDGFVDANGWKSVGEAGISQPATAAPTAATAAGAPVAPPWAR